MHPHFQFSRELIRYSDGTTLLGERLVVQFARGPRRNEEYPRQERAAPRPRRTPYRMQIANLPAETSWQVSLHLFHIVQNTLLNSLLRISKTLPVVRVPMSSTPKSAVTETAVKGML